MNIDTEGVRFNKEALKIVFIYVLIMVLVGAAFYYFGYVHGFVYGSEAYKIELEQCRNPFNFSQSFRI